MRDTPRTDAARFFIAMSPNPESMDSEFTDADFTRELERELAAKDATIEKLRAALEPLDLTRLWESMPADVQRKISCHNLKRICNAYNKDDGWADIISAPTDGTVFLAFCPHDQVGYAFACTRSTDARWICMMSGDQQFPTLWRSMPTLPARQALTDSK